MFPKMLVHTELLDFSAVLLTQLSNTMLIQFEQTVCNIVPLSYVIVITGIEKNQ